LQKEKFEMLSTRLNREREENSKTSRKIQKLSQNSERKRKNLKFPHDTHKIVSQETEGGCENPQKTHKRIQKIRNSI